MRSILPSLKSTITVPYSIIVYKVYESEQEKKGHDTNFPFQGLTLVSREAPIKLQYAPPLLARLIKMSDSIASAMLESKVVLYPDCCKYWTSSFKAPY